MTNEHLPRTLTVASILLLSCCSPAAPAAEKAAEAKAGRAHSDAWFEEWLAGDPCSPPSPQVSAPMKVKGVSLGQTATEAINALESHSFSVSQEDRDQLRTDQLRFTVDWLEMEAAASDLGRDLLPSMDRSPNIVRFHFENGESGYINIDKKGIVDFAVFYKYAFGSTSIPQDEFISNICKSYKVALLAPNGPYASSKGERSTGELVVASHNALMFAKLSESRIPKFD